MLFAEIGPCRRVFSRNRPFSICFDVEGLQGYREGYDVEILNEIIWRTNIVALTVAM